MRLKVSMVAIAVVLLASFSVSAVNMRGQAQAAKKCDDPKFLTEVGKDLTSVGESLKSFDPGKDAEVAKSLLGLAVIRQKYEDMTDVPDQCYNTQLLMVAGLANYGDAIALVIATKADPTNAAAYADALKPQIERANKLITAITSEVGASAAATPAK